MSSLGRLRLVHALKASDDAKRWQAATALAQVDDPRTLRRVERLLEKRGHEQGRAAEALGHLLQYQQVIVDIRTAIVSSLRDPEPEVRFWSVFAAGVLNLQESRPQLERLKGDEAIVEGWWSIGQEAEWALRCLDGEEDPPLPEPA